MMELKVQRIGNELGVILPVEMVQRLQCVEGAILEVEESSEGEYRMSRPDANLTAILAAGEKLMAQYDFALRELAK